MKRLLAAAFALALAAPALAQQQPYIANLLGGATLTGPLVVPDGTASAPGLQFAGATNYGFAYSSSQLLAIVNGVIDWNFTANYMTGQNAAGPRVQLNASNPVFIPDKADTNAGVGYNAAGNVSLYADESSSVQEVLRASSAGVSFEQSAYANCTAITTVSNLAGCQTGNPFYGPTAYLSGPYWTQNLYNPTTASLAANTLYAIPFIATTAKTFTKISFYVSATGTATECELGAYADNGSNYPGALITDAGEIDPASNTTQYEITSVSIPLTTGVNWLAIACNGTVTVEVGQGVLAGQIMGWSNGTTAYQRWQVSWSFSTGAMPNPYTSGGAENTGAGPNVYLRF